MKVKTIRVLCTLAFGLVFATASFAGEKAAAAAPEATVEAGEPAGKEVPAASNGTGGENEALEWTEDAMFSEIPTVISASRYEQGINEAPASISIVTADEILMFGYRSLSEVLEYTRGFYVSDDRNYRYAGVRGFSAPSDYNNRILVMINGHTTNEKWTGGSYIGNDFGVDLDLVDRIEIVRGPASALYGSNAVFAVINVITHGPGEMDGLSMKIGAGSFQTGTAGLFYGRSTSGGNGFVIGGSAMLSGGQELFFPEFNAPSTNLGVAEDADAELYGNLFGSLQLDNWTFEGKVNRRKKDIPTASYGTLFNDPGTFTVDGRSYAEARHKGITSGGAETSFRVYYDRIVFYGDYVVDYPPITVNRDEGGGDFAGLEYRVSKRVNPNHRLSAGAQYDYNFDVFQLNFDEDPFAVYLDQSFNFFNYSVYLQDEITVGSKLRFNLGVRYDKWQTFGESTNPMAAVIYSPGRRTTLKLLYGSAFRAPTIYELYYQDGGASTKSNPALGAEDIETYELVWEQALSKRFSLVGSVYHYQMDNLISQILDPMDMLAQFQNLDQVEADGVELELRGRMRNGLFLRASYTGQQVEDRSTGADLTNSPEHMVQTSFAFPVLKRRSSLALQARYMSKRLTFNRNDTDDVYLTDVTFNTGKLWPLYDVSVGIRNLFDHDYGDPGGAEHTQDVIPQDGRTFFILFRHRF